jgi:hypothetical protein
MPCGKIFASPVRPCQWPHSLRLWPCGSRKGYLPSKRTALPGHRSGASSSRPRTPCAPALAGTVPGTQARSYVVQPKTSRRCLLVGANMHVGLPAQLVVTPGATWSTPIGLLRRSSSGAPHCLSGTLLLTTHPCPWVYLRNVDFTLAWRFASVRSISIHWPFSVSPAPHVCGTSALSPPSPSQLSLSPSSFSLLSSLSCVCCYAIFLCFFMQNFSKKTFVCGF